MAGSMASPFRGRQAARLQIPLAMFGLAGMTSTARAAGLAVTIPIPARQSLKGQPATSISGEKVPECSLRVYIPVRVTEDEDFAGQA
jgi:hypothetical protein